MPLSIKAICQSFIIACTITLAGCVAIPKSTDTVLARRIAYLEGKLEMEAPVETAKPEVVSDSERLARIESQVARLVAIMEASGEPENVTEAEPVAVEEALTESKLENTLTPEEQEFLNSDEPIIKRSDDFKFQKVTGSTKRMVDRLTEKFTDGAKPKDSRLRNSLVGQPLLQSRFIGPDGSIVDLNDYTGKKGLVLVFLRGFPGFVCPACSAQTIALMKSSVEFEKRDTQVVLIYPGAAESVPAFIDSIAAYEKETPLTLPILLDVNLNAVKKFDISGALAKPTTIIVDKAGLVRYAYVGEKFDDRPSVANILAAIDEPAN